MLCTQLCIILSAFHYFIHFFLFFHSAFKLLDLSPLIYTLDCNQELTGVGGGLGAGLGLTGGAMVLGGGASSENVMELQRHLQFVEEEAELLRRSLIEMEEQNKLLMNEINRYKSDLPPPTSTLSPNSLSSLTDGLLHDSLVHSLQEGAVLISTDTPAQEEELRLTRLQIGELSGKVKKLQYENRVLLSNLQRCDLASYHVPSSSSSSPSLRLALETDAEAGDSAECLPTRYFLGIQVSVATLLGGIVF